MISLYICSRWSKNVSNFSKRIIYTNFSRNNPEAMVYQYLYPISQLRVASFMVVMINLSQTYERTGRIKETLNKERTRGSNYTFFFLSNVSLPTTNFKQMSKQIYCKTGGSHLGSPVGAIPSLQL